MSEVRILLIGEGKHELGECRDEYARPEDLPPLARLVSRLLGGAVDVRFFCRAGKDIRNIHHGKMASRLGKKVFSAIWYARYGRRDDALVAVVLVADRDGARNTRRLAELNEGRDQSPAESVPCALGLAIEKLDAWMIADAEAVGKAGGDAGKVKDRPEGLRDPKKEADELFDTSGGAGLGAKYAIVAEHVDIQLLERRCPEGFGPFAEEVRRVIGPVLSRE